MTIRLELVEMIRQATIILFSCRTVILMCLLSMEFLRYTNIKSNGEAICQICENFKLAHELFKLTHELMI